MSIEIKILSFKNRKFLINLKKKGRGLLSQKVCRFHKFSHHNQKVICNFTPEIKLHKLTNDHILNLLNIFFHTHIHQMQIILNADLYIQKNDTQVWHCQPSLMRTYTPLPHDCTFAAPIPLQSIKLPPVMVLLCTSLLFLSWVSYHAKSIIIFKHIHQWVTNLISKVQVI